MLTFECLARPALGKNNFGPVNLSVKAGEIVAVRGRSGAGKSVLLRSVADLDPHDGTVTLESRNQSDFSGPEWRRQVGYLGPESGWWSDRVGDHYEDEQAARALLGRLGLDDDAMDWPVERLSSGEKQRLALIRLMIQKPKVLLLDEPTSALDDDNRQAAEALIREAAKEGAAVLVITHDDEQSERIADRTVMLKDHALNEHSA